MGKRLELLCYIQRVISYHFEDPEVLLLAMADVIDADGLSEKKLIFFYRTGMSKVDKLRECKLK
jgi:hypothetical protein